MKKYIIESQNQPIQGDKNSIKFYFGKPKFTEYQSYLAKQAKSDKIQFKDMVDERIEFLEKELDKMDRLNKINKIAILISLISLLLSFFL